jgi:hypothetical protein
MQRMLFGLHAVTAHWFCGFGGVVKIFTRSVTSGIEK